MGNSLARMRESVRELLSKDAKECSPAKLLGKDAIVCEETPVQECESM